MAKIYAQTVVEIEIGDKVLKEIVELLHDPTGYSEAGKILSEAMAKTGKFTGDSLILEGNENTAGYSELAGFEF